MNENNKDLTLVKDEQSNKIESKVNIDEENFENRLEWDSRLFSNKIGFPHPHPLK